MRGSRGTLGDHAAELDDDHRICTRHRERHGVRDEHTRPAAQPAEDAALEDVRTHVSVDGGEDVVEYHNGGARVASAREVDSLLLPSGEVDAALSNLCQVALGQLGNVGAQRARLNDLVVSVLFKRLAEEHIVAQRGVRDPSLLGAV